MIRSKFDALPGAEALPDGRIRFRVWAPLAESVDLHVVAPVKALHPLTKGHRGYWTVEISGEPGLQYKFSVDGAGPLPDPASRFQPEGVHGPSEVISNDQPWTDATWHGLPLEDYVIYELHVGTFSSSGTFEGVIGHLDELRELGITAIELMPVAQFPGSRNWGYDGVYPYAAQSSYGGPHGLRTLVDAAHQRGMAVILDVVYNHLGPEGNYLGQYGPYFTEKYRTPWGGALNFDDTWSDGVREYFLGNVIYWIRDCHIDALRLDAVHAIFDQSAHPFLQELAETVDAASRLLNRQILAIAESDLNDPKLIRSRDRYGFGLHAQWSDDLHHAIHALMTGERSGYYADFGAIEHLARAFEQSYVYSGEYSEHRRRRHGAPATDVPQNRFIVFSQNHDQVGNRLAGDRLSASLGEDQQKLVAAVVILSPFTPLLFMGEEYAETRPFQYFTSHSDEALIDAVRKGRKEEFASFGWKEEPPDPHAESTFAASALDRSAGKQSMRETYRELLKLRRLIQPRVTSRPPRCTVHEGRALEVVRELESSTLRIVFNFSGESFEIPGSEGWNVLMNGRSLAPWGFAVLVKDDEDGREV